MPLPRASTLRILVLLSALCAAVFVTVYQHVASRSWEQSLAVNIHPINGDGTQATSRYIQSLKAEDFTIIDRWAQREAARYNLDLARPFKTNLGESITSKPPALSGSPSTLEVMSWSLRFRWWAWRNSPGSGSLKQVRLYVIYQQGNPGAALAHSLGLKKGLLGLVNAFADETQHAQNMIVIAHELLHTVGAEDKYANDGSPIWPQGYAHPDLDQKRFRTEAEIMAGRMITARGVQMAASLRHVVLNRWTAREINWLN